MLPPWNERVLVDDGILRRFRAGLRSAPSALPTPLNRFVQAIVETYSMLFWANDRGPFLVNRHEQ